MEEKRAKFPSVCMTINCVKVTLDAKDWGLGVGEGRGAGECNICQSKNISIKYIVYFHHCHPLNCTILQCYKDFHGLT